MFLPDAVTERSDFWYDFYSGVCWNPFGNILSFAVVALAILLTAVIIYFLDRRILMKAGLAKETAKKAARNMAIFTAPYLYLIPMELFYS